MGEVKALEGTHTGSVLKEKASFLIQTVNRGTVDRLAPALLPAFDAELRSFLGVPLASRGEVIGVLHFRSQRPEAYSEEDITLAERVGAQVAGAIANARLYADLTKAVTEASRLASVIEKSTDFVGMGSMDGHPVFANDAGVKMLGLVDRDQVSQLHVMDLFIGGEDPKFKEDLWREVTENGHWEGEILGRNIVTGETVPMHLNSITLEDPETGEPSVIAAIGRDITDLKEAEETRREVAVLGERNRLAREIHDTLAQGFTGIVLQLEAAEQVLTESPDEVRRHLERARDLARECLAEARRTVWNLVPKALEDQTLHKAIEKEIGEFGHDGPETVHFSLDGTPRTLPQEVQTAVLRICQESLTNVRKHARANEVTIDLTYRPDSVSLMIVDDGAGFDTGSALEGEGRGGFGLIGMRQRATLLKGALDVISGPGAGTTIKVVIPT